MIAAPPPVQIVLGEAAMHGDEELTATTPEQAVAVFRRVCLAPFPDEAAFRAAATSDPAKLSEADGGEVGQLAPNGRIFRALGGVWHGAHHNVRYFAAGSLPPTMSQPQCKVTVRLAELPAPSALAVNVGTLLALKDARSVTVGAHLRTIWDLARSNGQWRVILKSETSANGNFMALSVLKLQG